VRSRLEFRKTRRGKLLRAKRFVAVAVAIGVATAWVGAAGSSSGSGYEPVLRASNFVPVINNRYYPLPVGRVWVYRGIKDGQTQVDTVSVLAQTKLVAEGIRARVVSDIARHGSKVLERTFDWYAQDRQGNVWYLGEDTTAYLAHGKADKSGSWEAGVGDGEPGLIMKAVPRVPDAYRQEYLAGKAEDTAWIVGGTNSLTVPYGTVHHVLTSLEATRVEPGLYDKKVYAPGVGIVLEQAVTGPTETARLVSMRG
jgi:hypothetical protein